MPKLLKPFPHTQISKTFIAFFLNILVFYNRRLPRAKLTVVPLSKISWPKFKTWRPPTAYSHIHVYFQISCCINFIFKTISITKYIFTLNIKQMFIFVTSTQNFIAFLHYLRHLHNCTTNESVLISTVAFISYGAQGSQTVKKRIKIISFSLILQWIINSTNTKYVRNCHSAICV